MHRIVADATLYRHFPNRRALATAVYEDIVVNDIKPAILAPLSESDVRRAEPDGRRAATAGDRPAVMVDYPT